MKRQINIQVSGCGECPFRKHERYMHHDQMDGHYECDHDGGTVFDDDHDLQTFPSWCPLPLAKTDPVVGETPSGHTLYQRPDGSITTDPIPVKDKDAEGFYR